MVSIRTDHHETDDRYETGDRHATDDRSRRGRV